jgi:hypothetical protein
MFSCYLLEEQEFSLHKLQATMGQPFQLLCIAARSTDTEVTLVLFLEMVKKLEVQVYQACRTGGVWLAFINIRFMHSCITLRKNLELLNI